MAGLKITVKPDDVVMGQSTGNICLDFYFLNIYFHKT